MIALRYLKKKKIPYVFAINGGVVRPHENKFKRALKHYFIKGANFYLSPCEEASRYLLHYGAKKKDIYHYPYSTIYQKEIISKKLTSIEKQYRRKQKGIIGEQVFVSVGQFINRKNNMLLLEVWRKMPKNRTLLLIGEGPDKKKYENFIATHQLTNVMILDFQKRADILELLSISDYAIFLSKEDIYGHVINEALSQGLGVVASDKMVAALKLIENDVNGYIVNIENVDEIIQAINKIATKDFFAEAIATASKNTIELMVARHVEIFQGEKR
jgi:glycosyltransferase involved in cell wall biosynthesis